jgi:AcrR family transcriptional regulator
VSERTYHHGNLRAALLDRAWDVVDAHGADALSLRRLAREVGVSHGASARHFRDKQALLDALALQGFGRLNAALADAAGSPLPFAHRFRAVAEAYVAFAVAHPALLAVMYTAKHHPEASEDLRDASHAGMSGLVDLFAAGHASGDLRPGDPQQQALVAFAAVHGVATLATDDLLDGVPWQDAAAATIAFVWEGLAAPAPGDDPARPAPATRQA